MNILKNICSDDYSLHILSKLGDDYFPWYWNDNTVDYNNNTPDSYKEKDYQFTHVFFRDGEYCSSYAELIKPLIISFQAQSGLIVKNIYRIKANLTTPISYTEKEIVSAMHIDTPIINIENKKYVSFIYYVIDSDGDTVIYNKYNDDKLSVTPTRNTGVWFDSDFLHYPNPPKKSKRRLIINFIFEIYN